VIALWVWLAGAIVTLTALSRVCGRKLFEKRERAACGSYSYDNEDVALDMFGWAWLSLGAAAAWPVAALVWWGMSRGASDARRARETTEKLAVAENELERIRREEGW
jgi:hypothetical protein